MDKVQAVMKASMEPRQSIDRPIGEEEDSSSLSDFIEDERAVAGPRSRHSMLKVQMTRVLSTLTRREEKVIRLALRVGGRLRLRTLEEVGTIFKVTRERVRQIEAKALRKLRHPSRSAEAQGLRRDGCRVDHRRSEMRSLDHRGVILPGSGFGPIAQLVRAAGS